MSPSEAPLGARNPWLLRGYPDRAAKVRLFCFPYAGAGGVLYAKWQAVMPSAVDVCAIMPPGRLGRLKEPSFTTIRPYVAALATTLAEMVDRPYFLFGYSMGGLLAFEVARELIDRGLPAPKHLVVAACRPPHLGRSVKSPDGLSDDELIELLSRRYAPLPQVVLADPELREIALAVMRADLAVLASYQFERGFSLSSPITALGGLDDRGCPPDALAEWSQHTSAPFELRTFPGGHFFLNEQPGQVIQVVRSLLEGHLASRGTQTDAARR